MDRLDEGSEKTLVRIAISSDFVCIFNELLPNPRASSIGSEVSLEIFSVWSLNGMIIQLMKLAKLWLIDNSHFKLSTFDYSECGRHTVSSSSSSSSFSSPHQLITPQTMSKLESFDYQIMLASHRECLWTCKSMPINLQLRSPDPRKVSTILTQKW